MNDRYQEALKRARQGKPLDEIFPELNKSEDERIRRSLVEYFGPEVQLDFVRGVPIQKIRDWLEKQKEQKPVKLNDDTKVGLDRALQIVKAAKGNLCGYQSDDGIYECCHAIQTLERILKNGIEQKPMEPSDEELQRHQDELYDFKVFAAKQAKEYHISFVHDFEWHNFCAELLSYFNEKKKPAEWSKEDTEDNKVLKDIILAFRRIANGCEHYFSPDTAKVFVKTLENIRAKHHYKPTPEQMKALNDVSDKGPLLDLFNDLLSL